MAFYWFPIVYKDDDNVFKLQNCLLIDIGDNIVINWYLWYRIEKMHVKQIIHTEI